MTHRERMLAAIRGERSDFVPWAPRMDLWYIANRAAGALPKGFEGLDIVEIAKKLDVGCHAMGADFTRPAGRDIFLRALGCDNHQDYPYRIELRGLPVEWSDDGTNLRTRIRTPAGEVFLHLYRDAEMMRNGISIPFVKSYAIRSKDDLEAVGQVFERLVVIPTPESYAAFKRRVGQQGIAVARGPIAASPMHLILHDLAPMDLFYYLYADDRKALRYLAERMTPFFEAMLDALVKCEAEVVLWGANYDQDLTWPPFFQEEIAPWLKKVSDRLHAAGKFLLTHTDGENKGLLRFYPACGFDVAESVCPSPMTQCTLAEIRKGMGPKLTVWGGIPSVALLDESMPDAAFDAYLDDLFCSLGSAERLIFGVSDNVPPRANLDRLEEIKRRIQTYARY